MSSSSSSRLLEADNYEDDIVHTKLNESILLYTTGLWCFEFSIAYYFITHSREKEAVM